jgi:pyruvate dehydrogenase phosphatase
MYVKGRLMCTRSLGDLALKHKEFNIENTRFEVIPEWDGPYITHIPEVVTREITADMRYVVLGSDGLWDEIGLDESAQVVLASSCAEAAAKALLDKALENAAKRFNLTVE